MTVEAAATAQAVQAQFEQVFGNSQTVASDAINGMAKQFRMLPNQIKPSFRELHPCSRVWPIQKKRCRPRMRTTQVMPRLCMILRGSNSALNSFKGNEGGRSLLNTNGIMGGAEQALTGTGRGRNNGPVRIAKAIKQAAPLQAARESESYQNKLGVLETSVALFRIVGASFGYCGADCKNFRMAAKQAAKCKSSKWFVFRDEVANSTAFQTLQEVFQGIADKFTALRENLRRKRILDNVKYLLISKMRY